MVALVWRIMRTDVRCWDDLSRVLASFFRWAEFVGLCSLEHQQWYTIVNKRPESGFPPALPAIAVRLLRNGGVVRIVPSNPLWVSNDFAQFLRSRQALAAPVLEGSRASWALVCVSDSLGPWTVTVTTWAAIALGLKLASFRGEVRILSHDARLLALATEGRANQLKRHLKRTANYLRTLQQFPTGQAEKPPRTSTENNSTPSPVDHLVQTKAASQRAIGLRALKLARMAAGHGVPAKEPLPSLGREAEEAELPLRRSGILRGWTPITDPTWPPPSGPVVGVLFSQSQPPTGGVEWTRSVLHRLTTALAFRGHVVFAARRDADLLVITAGLDETDAETLAREALNWGSPGAPLIRAFVSRTHRPEVAWLAVEDVERLRGLSNTDPAKAEVLSMTGSGALGLLLSVGDRDELAKWARGKLRGLSPSGAHKQLFETLEVYLETWGSIRSVAARLFLHPNTVKYRIKRITEMLDVDLRDYRARVDLLFACYAARAAEA